MSDRPPDARAPRTASSSRAGFAAELLARLQSSGNKGRHYRSEGEVARGGMGAIFKVWDDDLRRSLAMKVMLGQVPLDELKSAPARASAPEDDPNTSAARNLGRFLEEAQITGQLDHPGIVPVHELGLDSEGRIYFTMRLVRGRDLMQVFELVQRREEDWNVTRALSVMLKVCEAVAYAHSKGVIHRDLKPANVMVGGFGEVYVMDWGLARLIGQEDLHDLRLRRESTDARMPVRTARSESSSTADDSPLVTMDGDILGTPSYMSPEQARGEISELGPRSDVYALGAMLYQLLTGEVPYARRDGRGGVQAVLERVMSGPPMPLHELAPDIPAELAAITEKAMARKPADRYEDVLAMADDLRAFLEGRVVRAYRTGAVVEFVKWVQRNRALAASLALLVFVSVAGSTGAALVFAGKNEEIRKKAGDLEVAKTDAEEQRDLVLGLADGKQLADLRAEAGDLWPAEPSRVAAMEAWLARAKELGGHLARHREHLVRIAAVVADIDTGRHDLPPASVSSDASKVAATISAGKGVELTWLKEQLGNLVKGLERFQGGSPSGGTVASPSASTVASVEQRLAFARTVHAKSIDDHRREWERAAESIRDRERCPRYAGLDLVPQLGLVPIGQDASSQLWEFAHLATGTVPARNGDGSLAFDEHSGLVFVLIPAGRFSMGAQNVDATGANYDSQADIDESPVHEVDVDAFFMSKFEMTQAQWLRFTGTNPSTYQPPMLLGGKRHSLQNPVENLSWVDGDLVLRHLGLALPTEAQWEYAARGGTSTPWWTGVDVKSLQGAANLADRFCQTHGGQANWSYEPEIDDGWTAHAPVGSYRANAFGLHDVAGNVFEWCSDPYALYGPVGLDPEFARAMPTRSARGGGWIDPAIDLRSAHRYNNQPSFHDNDLGLRPARAIQH